MRLTLKADRDGCFKPVSLYDIVSITAQQEVTLWKQFVTSREKGLCLTLGPDGVIHIPALWACLGSLLTTIHKITFTAIIIPPDYCESFIMQRQAWDRPQEIKSKFLQWFLSTDIWPHPLMRPPTAPCGSVFPNCLFIIALLGNLPRYFFPGSLPWSVNITDILYVMYDTYLSFIR